ncbi:UNVERIFIED_CONTAM: hypothetical protein Sradi_0828500 [Sesamum radiatum]|uniref:Uncharacterized protein n=1 Tax=Sesamum radiatum TaxID=300843 RepID=A0AAW2VRF1_SESRA
MAKVVSTMKKSFLHLFESVKSCGSGGARVEYEGETKFEAQSVEAEVMAVRARGPTTGGKPKPPPPQTAKDKS